MSSWPPEPAPDPDTMPTTILRRHGLPPRRRPRRQWVLAALIALLALVMLVAAWRTLQDHRTAPSPVPAVVPSAAASTSAPAAIRSSAPSDAGTPAPQTTPPSQPSPAGPAVVASPRWNRAIEVVVLNATGRTGLAAAAAQQLRSKGWTISSIGNWRAGGVARTTVFASRYPRAVRTLLHDVPSAGAHRRPLFGMPRDGLVLVLGQDYQH